MVSTLTFVLTFVCGSLTGVVGVFVGAWALHLTNDSDPSDSDTDDVWRYATDVLDPSAPANSHEELPRNRLVVEQNDNGDYRKRKLSNVVGDDT